MVIERFIHCSQRSEWVQYVHASIVSNFTPNVEVRGQQSWRISKTFPNSRTSVCH